MIWDVIVIGAGGRIGSWLLAAAGRDEVSVVGSGMEAGETWKTRYDSLKLFTPRTHGALYGMRLEDPDGFPDKDEMASYLKSYAARFRLPIQFETDVKCVRKEEDRFIIDTHQGEYHAKALIIATGPFRSLEFRRLQHRFQRTFSAALIRLQATFPASGGRRSCRWRREQRGTDCGRTVTWSGNVFGPRTAAALFTHDHWGKGMFWWLDKLGILSAGVPPGWGVS